MDLLQVQMIKSSKNYVVAPVKTKFDFSKALAGRELKTGEFSFVLKDSTGKVLQTKTNTKEGVVAFDDLTFDNTQVGTHKYTVEEVIPENKEAGMTYDTMKAEVTITVTKEGHVLKATNTLPSDTEFNNKVTPPDTPDFNPEKNILNESKFDLTGIKLLDDDSELKDKVADTNANPYADKVDNNEAQNINTKTLKKGDKFVYQVWLNATNFTDAHNIPSVGVTDKYDSENLNINIADIKAYDSVTGEDVTAKFDIQIVDGVITATSKAVKATSNGSKGSKGSGPGSVADGASDGKGLNKKKSGNKDGKKADGSDKAKEGNEQLPVKGESDNNLAAMGVVVMGLMSGLAAMNRRKNKD